MGIVWQAKLNVKEIILWISAQNCRDGIESSFFLAQLSWPEILAESEESRGRRSFAAELHHSVDHSSVDRQVRTPCDFRDVNAIIVSARALPTPTLSLSHFRRFSLGQ
jgi:hypothetical protein